MRKKEFLVSLLILSTFLLSINVFYSQVKAGSGSFTEDFTSTTYRDGTSTTVEGWGSGTISSPKRAIEQIDSIDPGDKIMDVYVEGDYAFVARTDEGLGVVDISDPSDVTYINTYNTDYEFDLITEVVVEGNYAYIVTGSNGGFEAVDISNPGNPVFGGRTAYTGTFYGLDVDGNYAYLAAASGGLRIHSISNPTSLSAAIGSYDTPGTARKVFVDGDLAYIADESGGLQIIDIKKTNAPSYLGSVSVNGNAYDVVVEGEIAYIAAGSSGLAVINVTNPLSPSTLATYDTSDFAQGVTVNGNYLYLATGSAGIIIFDITNPSSPQLIDQYNTLGYSYSIVVKGEYAFVADWTRGLIILQVSDYVTPNYIGSYNTPDSARSVVVRGDYAYVADYKDGGLQVIDISDPSSPSLAGSYNTAGYATDVAVSGDYAVIADPNSGLRVLDISNPKNPTNAGLYGYTTSWLGSVDISGNYAYAALGAYGVRAVNITTPTSPLAAGYLNTGDSAEDIMVSGDRAYIADGTSGLRVLNIANPHSLDYITSWDPQYTANGVYVYGNYLFSAHYSVLRIVNIINPSSLVELDNYYTPGIAMGVYATGDFVFVADGASGLTVCDFSNPTNLVSKGSYNTPGTAYGVVVDGQYAFIADGDSGLQIVEVFRHRSRQYEPSTIAQSSTVYTSGSDALITEASLSATDNVPTGTDITYYLSADGGIHWEEVLLGMNHVFTYPGYTLKWKAELVSSNTLYTPSISSVSINYNTKAEAPSLVSPNDEIITNETVNFQWSLVSSATEYLLQIDRQTSFNTGDLINVTLGVTEYSLSLDDGLWYWRVASLDSSNDRGFFSSTQSLTVDTTAPVISPVENITLIEGTIGEYIYWPCSDEHPDSYTTTRDGEILNSLDWYGGTVYSSLDSLSWGTHSFGCTVNDTFGKTTTSFIYVTVVDGINPVINQPDNITYEEESLNNIITWNATDLHQKSYEIFKDGENYTSGEWNEDQIELNIDGLLKGEYLFSCFVYDIDNNVVSSNVTVTVVDHLLPIITSLGNITIQENKFDAKIIWEVSDNHPGIYYIYRDGTLLFQNTWSSTNPISVSIESLPIGFYNYTLVVFDGSDNKETDTIFVTVVEQIETTTTSVATSTISTSETTKIEEETSSTGMTSETEMETSEDTTPIVTSTIGFSSLLISLCFVFLILKRKK